MVERVFNNVLPVNRTDAIALIHDIDYLRFCGDASRLYAADEIAIRNAGNDLSGLVMQIGLGAIPFTVPTPIPSGKYHPFASPLKGMSVSRTRRIGEFLLKYIQESPLFVKCLAGFGVSFGSDFVLPNMRQPYIS